MQWCANKNGLHTLRDITITSPHRHSNLRRADEPKALSANGPKHRPNHCTSMRIMLRSSAYSLEIALAHALCFPASWLPCNHTWLFTTTSAIPVPSFFNINMIRIKQLGKQRTWHESCIEIST